MSPRARQPGDKLRESLREAQIILDNDQTHPATWRLVATILLTALRLEASRAGQTIDPTMLEISLEPVWGLRGFPPDPATDPDEDNS